MSAAAPPISAPPVAQLVEASKWYGEVIGLNQVSLEIGPGITGLLGPNGAGKSTFLKLLTGQLKPSRGQVRVLGKDPWSDPGVFQQVGYCPDTEQLYEEMTGWEFVLLMGRLAGYDAADSRRRAEVQLERLSMTHHCRRPIRGYSKGMRQRVRLAAALLHDPQLIILDEPLNGLDPMGRHEMLALFKQLAAEGKAVVVSSHVLHEIQNLTRRMIMLHRGRLLAEGEIEDIRALIESQPLTLRIESPQVRPLAARLVELPEVTSIEIAQSETAAPPALVVRTSRPEAVYNRVQDAVLQSSLSVTAIEALDDNLDAIFRYLVVK